MKKALILFGATAFLLGIAHAAGLAPVVQDLMKDGAAPLSRQVWDIGNRAVDDRGQPDATKLSPADWATLAAHARSLKALALALGDASKLSVAPEGATLGDGVSSGATAPMVQAYIDLDPKAFESHARDLDAAADAILRAAQAKDAVKLVAASDNLGLVCEACHAKFWYPDQ